MDEMSSMPANQPSSQLASQSTIQSLQSQPPKKIRKQKVTFNIPEELVEQFDHIYAQRILNGVKTDKTTLICEAITLLLDKEKKSG